MFASTCAEQDFDVEYQTSHPVDSTMALFENVAENYFDLTRCMRYIPIGVERIFGRPSVIALVHCDLVPILISYHDLVECALCCQSIGSFLA